MNYHIMIDDKFIDGFIDDVEKISSNGKNKYYIRGNKLKPNYVKHNKAEWVRNSKNELKKLLESITEKDKLFIHWYDLRIGNCILKYLDERVSLYCALWGADFYEDPYLYNINWIHDSKTLCYVLKNNIVSEKYKSRPHLIFKRIWKTLNYKKIALKEFQIKKKTVERIDYLMLYKGSDFEFNFVKQLFGLEKIKSLPFNYDLNVHLALFTRLKANTEKRNISDSITIQIGNSATASNNHVDSFHAIEKFSKEKIKVFIPLAYGNKEYSTFVKASGDVIFTDKIEYVENFLPREEYISKLLDTDVCIMYHNRQQAFGNCIPLLMLGKKVYLKNTNPLFHLFKEIGLIVFDASLLDEMSFEEFKKPLTDYQIQKNIGIITDYFSEEKRLQYLKAILC